MRRGTQPDRTSGSGLKLIFCMPNRPFYRLVFFAFLTDLRENKISAKQGQERFFEI
jgi:hypothetical protein